jgi:hypothetical protein
VYQSLGVPHGSLDAGYDTIVARTENGTTIINNEGPFNDPTHLRLSSGEIANFLEFFNTVFKEDLSTPVDAAAFQEIITLHEFGHAKGLLKNDLNDPDQGIKNTRTIIKNCFQ